MQTYRHAPMRTASGAVVQAGLSKGPPPDALETTFLVRGVVTAVYVVDDPNHPYALAQPAAAYCDVMVYTKLTGGRLYPLHHVLCSYGASGVQGGEVALPRASTQSLAGAGLDTVADVDVTSLDGDHVLVGFIDHSRQQPVILRYLPHPRADVGLASNQPPGRRLRLRRVDGRPDLRKHQGAFHGIDSSGNVVANAVAATGDRLTPTGAEVPSAGTGSVQLAAGPLGTCTVRIAQGTPAGEVDLVKQVLSAAGFSLTFVNGPGAFAIAGAAGPLIAFAAPGAGGAATAGVKVGTGGTAAAKASSVADKLNDILTWLKTHTHGGPGTPPVQAPALVPLQATTGGLSAKGLDLPG